MTFVPPTLLLLFAATFFSVWTIDRGSRHLLLFSLSFLAFGFAVFSQIVLWPRDIGYNNIVSTASYIGGSLLFAEGILARSGRSLPPVFHVAWFAVIVTANCYFYYIDRNLLVRIYILNLGMGSIFLMAAWHARFLAAGSRNDRILFWLMLAFAAHFFPRTLLTATSVSDDPETISAFFQSTFWAWAQFSLTILGAAMGLGVLAITAADTIAVLRRERDSDPLTALLNRRGLDGSLRKVLAKDAPQPISVVVCDIDHFKSINDTFGHAAGDAVLAGFARIVRKTARASDPVGRIGGEEFVIVLEGTTVDEALEFAERLRTEIQRARFAGVPPMKSVTCSFGIAAHRKGEDLWATIARGDKLLYAAKRAGRNRTFAEGIHLPLAA